MSQNMNDFIKELPLAERKAIKARAAQIIKEEMTLRQLRQAHRLTQKKLAKSLNIGQEGISKLEKRTDLLISTLRDYIEAMGGSLSLIAEFPNSKPIALAGIGDESAKLKKRKSA